MKRTRKRRANKTSSQQKEGNHKDQKGNQQNRDSKNKTKIQYNQKLVLWKSKKNWQTLGQTHQEEERKNSNKIKNEKGENTMDTAEIKKKKKKREKW